MPTNLFFHPATDSAAHQQFHLQVHEPSGPRKPWYRIPVFVVDQLFFERTLEEDHYPPATIKDWGNPALIFGDGKSHCFHLQILLSSFVPDFFT
jgi:hypothetical protein